MRLRDTAMLFPGVRATHSAMHDWETSEEKEQQPAHTASRSSDCVIFLNSSLLSS
jgi:hypothetical protein